MVGLMRRYKKILLSFMILGITSIFVAILKDNSHSEALVIYNGIVRNTSFLRSQPTMRLTTKKTEFVKPPSDAIRQGSVKLPLTKNDSSGTKAVSSKVTKSVNVSKVANIATKSTFYPVTLNAPYLIENPTLCSSVKNLSILVIVHTAPNHFDRRINIRLTWTNETYFKHLGRVRVLFLLGRVKDDKLQKDIEAEFAQYGDLLQGDFIDAYRNLTHKGVMAYKWLTERCRNAKLILKVDDDVIINMYDMLTKYLPAYQNKTKQIFCNHILPGTMPIIRKNTSKWYVDESQFRGKSFYPRYCSGFTVVFTNDVIPALYRAAGVTPFFWVDDVYLYGLVPANVLGIKYNGFKNGDHQLSGVAAVNCYKNVTKTCSFFITGSGNREVVESIWSFMTKAYESRIMQHRATVATVIPKALPTATNTTSVKKIPPPPPPIILPINMSST